MAERIIGVLCCLLCAFPFFAIPMIKLDSGDPINFWSGDESLKEKLGDIEGYNREMARVFRCYALAFLAAALAFALYPIAGAVLLCINCSVSVWLFYRAYKKILSKYSK